MPASSALPACPRVPCSFQQQTNIAYGLLILSRRAQPFDAGPETTFDVILQTRTRRFAVNLDITGAQLKCAIDQINSFARQAGWQKRSKVKRAVALNATGDYDF